MKKNVNVNLERKVAFAKLLIKLNGDCGYFDRVHCGDICPIRQQCDDGQLNTKETVRLLQEWFADNNKPESPWQPIETAPKDGAYFLWSENAGDHDIVKIEEIDRNYYIVNNTGMALCCLSCCTGSHWMPLPNLPEV